MEISFRFAATPCVCLNYREAEVQVLKGTLISQLVSRLSLSEIMVWGRTDVGQLISQLSLLSEKYGSGRTMGTSRILIYISISML